MCNIWERQKFEQLWHLALAMALKIIQKMMSVARSFAVLTDPGLSRVGHETKIGMNMMAEERVLFAGSPGKQEGPADSRTALQHGSCPASTRGRRRVSK